MLAICAPLSTAFDLDGLCATAACLTGRRRLGRREQPSPQPIADFERRHLRPGRTAAAALAAEPMPPAAHGGTSGRPRGPRQMSGHGLGRRLGIENTGIEPADATAYRAGAGSGCRSSAVVCASSSASASATSCQLFGNRKETASAAVRLDVEAYMLRDLAGPHAQGQPRSPPAPAAPTMAQQANTRIPNCLDCPRIPPRAVSP